MKKITLAINSVNYCINLASQYNNLYLWKIRYARELIYLCHHIEKNYTHYTCAHNSEYKYK